MTVGGRRGDDDGTERRRGEARGYGGGNGGGEYGQGRNRGEAEGAVREKSRGDRYFHRTNENWVR